MVGGDISERWREKPNRISSIMVRTQFPENTASLSLVRSRICVTRARGLPASSLTQRTAGICSTMRSTLPPRVLRNFRGCYRMECTPIRSANANSQLPLIVFIRELYPSQSSALSLRIGL